MAVIYTDDFKKSIHARWDDRTESDGHKSSENVSLTCIIEFQHQMADDNIERSLLSYDHLRKDAALPTATLRTFIGLSSFEMLAMFRRGLFYAYLSIYLRHYLGLSVTETTLFATLPMVLNVLAQTFVWVKSPIAFNCVEP